MLRRVCRTAVVIAAIALSSLAVHPSAQDAPTFRSSVQVIEVDASVIDQQGKFVSGLTGDDFEVLEDGVIQNIESFTVGLPRRRPSGSKKDETPAADTNAGAGAANGAAGQTTQRTDYVIIFNSVERLRYVRQQNVARTFIRTVVAPGDRLAIVETAMGLPSELPFQTTREEMLKAVDRVSGLPCAVDARSFWMIRDVVSRLTRVQGSRKEVVFISEGTPLLWHGVLEVADDRSIAKIIDLVTGTRRAFEEAMRVATIARIPVHAVDPGGMRAASSPVVSSGATLPFVEAFDDPTGSRRRLAMATRDGGYFQEPEHRKDATNRTVQNERVSMMRLVSEVTGGRDVVNTNSFEKNFRSIVEDQPPSYLLSYSSPANQRDGRFHAIEVRVKRPGLKVRSRKGYYAFRPGGSIVPAVSIPESVSPQARTIIAADSPTADVDATARAASLSVGTPQAAVMVGLQVKNAATTFDPSKPIEIVWSAVSDDGYGALTAVERRLVHMTAPASGAVTLVAFDKLRLPEGQYRITGIASQEGARTAMALTDVDVEARPSEPYGFTDIVLGSSAATDQQIVHEDEDITRMMPHPPVIGREFARGETLALYTEFHDVSESFEKVVLRLTVSSPRSGVKIRTDKTMTFKKTNREAAVNNPLITIEGRRFSYSNTIPLARFEPGAYTLKIEAIGSGTREATVSREVAFIVY